MRAALTREERHSALMPLLVLLAAEAGQQRGGFSFEFGKTNKQKKKSCSMKNVEKKD